ncbi:UNVERIFIED_CONTAM: hypothetical protein FKN15_045145 [Acipenser sinensis]
MPGKKVCIVGSGNWGSAIAKIIGKNVTGSNRFDPIVNMWVFEEVVNGKKLTEIINSEHENVKYLPGHKLPKNVVAVPDVAEASTGADILVFVVPHQFISKLCDQIKPKIKPETFGISLIKGVDEGHDGLKLISNIIQEKLEIEVSVLMGANIASEVADEKFCETTIGNPFRHLQSIVAVGAGFCDGLGLGDNTKAAVIRLGLMEMVAFAKLFCKGTVTSVTFLESCGVADLITTCYGGRNRKVAEAFVKTKKSIEELEKEMLNGQKLQGCRNVQHGQIFKELFQTPNFRITVVEECDTVELCGALKNIVAVGAGFCDGLGLGDNTKAAVIRLGLMEMVAFAKLFCKGTVTSVTFLESCGVADLITTCYGGRNRKVAETFVKTKKSIEELEKEMLNGQKLQGPQTSAEVYKILKNKNMVNKNVQHGQIFKELFQTPNFRITVVEECDTVELCGALKSIVAVGAGFCDGLGLGDNTKAAVIRLGLMEMVAFAKLFCKGTVTSVTFLESCGVADLITTCYGGRNRKVAEAFVKTKKSIEELEKEMLNGQKLQGPQTSAEVYKILKNKNMVNKL